MANSIWSGFEPTFIVFTTVFVTGLIMLTVPVPPFTTYMKLPDGFNAIPVGPVPRFILFMSVRRHVYHCNMRTRLQCHICYSPDVFNATSTGFVAPTEIVLITVFVCTLITDTVPEPSLGTYSKVPIGFSPM